MNRKHDNRTDRASELRTTGDQETAAEPLEEAPEPAVDQVDRVTDDMTEVAADEEDAADGSSVVLAKDRELEAVRDRHLRLAAEFDNYRKRTERERSESSARAQAQLIGRLLDALDDLQRVAQIDASQSTASALLEGVQLVERKLFRALESAGLETVDAQDQQFDPAVHEALVTSPIAERERDDTVAEVFQPGYLFKGNLIRPARVRVHKYEG